MSNTVWHPELSIILTEDIGEGCTLHAPIWVGRHVRIGNRVKVEAFSFIPEGVTLEDDVFVGPHFCGTNDKYPPSDRGDWLPILIKRGAVIGANVTIVCGVTIGEKAMIGAGSVVTKNVGAGELWYGNPAKKRGMRK